MPNSAIFGYSHGGHATFVLTRRLVGNDGMPVQFTSYVDAVSEEFRWDMRQEQRRPASAYHINQYQHGSVADGWQDGCPVAGSDWESDVETSAWGAGATHGTIDDFEEVRSEIRNRLMANLPNP